MADKIDVIYSKVLDRYIEIRYNTKLHSLSFIPKGKQLKEKKTNDAAFALENYFNGTLTDFSSDVDLSHLSTFEQKVLNSTRKINMVKQLPIRNWRKK